MAATFASFLLGHDLVTAAELEEAAQATVLYGGRLGTALLELGFLAPAELDSALSRFMDLPPIPKEWLAKPDAAARTALHVDLVKRHRAFPLLFEKRTLHVGMVDPRDQTVLGALAFASGCLIAPHALPEFRFVQLMQRVYGVTPSARFRTLLEENQRARMMRKRARAREVQAPKRAPEEDELAIGPLLPDHELTDEASFQLAPATSPKPPIAEAQVEAGSSRPAAASLAPAVQAPEPELEVDDTPAPLAAAPRALVTDANPMREEPPPTLAALEKLVAESTERSEVIDASLALAARFAEAAAIFVIREDVAVGLCATRAGEPLGVESTQLRLSGDGLAALCARERKAACGPPTAGLDKRLAKALRAGEGGALGVFPVVIGERVVNLIVVECASAAFPKLAEAALGALARLLGGAYERLIRIQKQKSGTAAAPPAPAPEEAPAAMTGTLGALPLRKRVVRVAAPKR